MGSRVFEDDPLSNRSLLIELCATHQLCLANSFHEHGLENLVTYRDLGVPPLKTCEYPDFAQLDYLVIPQEQLDRVLDISSDRSRHIRSQHFILHATLEVHLEKEEKDSKKKAFDLEEIDEEVFREKMLEKLPDVVPNDSSVAYEVLVASFHDSAHELLRHRKAFPKKL